MKKKYTPEQVQFPLSSRNRFYSIWYFNHQPGDIPGIGILCLDKDPIDGEIIKIYAIKKHLCGEPVLRCFDPELRLSTILEDIVPFMRDFDRFLIELDAIDRGWKWRRLREDKYRLAGCVCTPTCPSNCKGQCGCKVCADAYQDFLSAE